MGQAKLISGEISLDKLLHVHVNRIQMYAGEQDYFLISIYYFLSAHIYHWRRKPGGGGGGGGVNGNFPLELYVYLTLTNNYLAFFIFHIPINYLVDNFNKLTQMAVIK